MIRPILEYHSNVWDPPPSYTHTHTHARACARARAHTIECRSKWPTQSCSLHSQPAEQHLLCGGNAEMLEWPTLQQRRQAARLIMLCEITNGQVASVKCPDLTFQPYSRRRGYSLTYKRIQCCTDDRSNTFFSLTISAWNERPPKVAEAPSAGAVTSRLSSQK